MLLELPTCSSRLYPAIMPCMWVLRTSWTSYKHKEDLGSQFCMKYKVRSIALGEAFRMGHEGIHRTVPPILQDVLLC